MAMPVISVEKKDVSLTCFVWILPCGFMCTCASRYVPLFYDPLQGGSRYHSSLVVFIPFAEDNSSIPRSGAIIDVHGVDPVRTYWQVGQKYCVCRAEIQGRPYLPVGVDSLKLTIPCQPYKASEGTISMERRREI